MRKIKIFLTYLMAICCICMTLIYKPKETMVFDTHTNHLKDRITIYMLDERSQLVPVSLSYQKSDSDIENIVNGFQLMKQNLDIYTFDKLIPDSIQCLGIDILNNVVKINLNEAFFTMNSQYELKFIEGIVGNIISINEDYKVEFYVNGDKVEKMPLSGMVMKIFDISLGVNNFNLDTSDLHLSTARQVVSLVNGEYSYYTVTTKRIPKNDSTLQFVNEILHDTSTYLNCEKIEVENDKMILHLDEYALLDENTIDQEKVICMLYTLKLNNISNRFIIKVNNEIKSISGFSSQEIYFEDLNLNVFEV